MHAFYSLATLLVLTSVHTCNVVAQSSQPSPPTELTLTGHITPEEIFSFVYAPFNVSPEVTSIYVLQNYSFQGAGNSLDLGIFDPRGIGAIDSDTGFTGSRGWSGGFRNNFTISASDATPGYNAGPLLPGTWSVVLGPYATNRSGIDWTLSISLSYASNDTLWSPAYAPIVKESFPPNETSQWLRGDFHMHSVYSDGRYLPSQQIANALTRDLDFIFFSEHNTDSGNNNIGDWIPSNASDLLIGRAIEVTTRFGHWQAIGLERGQQVDWRYTNATNDTGYADAAREVRESGGIVSVNHPFQNCSRCDWTLDWDHHDAIEVWNGRFDPLDDVAVQFWKSELARTGKRVTAIGGSDAHSPPEINGLPTTVVRAVGERSQASVVEAVKRGRVYLVEGPGMDLTFTVSYGDKKKAEIGDAVPTSLVQNKTAASFAATGFSDGAMACFVNEKGYFHNASIVDGERIEQLVAGMEFILVEVRNSTGVLLGLTNPIYFPRE